MIALSDPPRLDVVDVIAYVEPRPKLRERHRVVNGRVLTHAHPKDVTAEWDLRQWVHNALPDDFTPFVGPVRLLFAAYRSPTKAVAAQLARGKTVPPPSTKPDMGNLIKLLEDALRGLVYVDDQQIVECWGHKRWAEDLKPRWHVRVMPA